MSALINAHEIGRTRHCSAFNCPHDAATGRALCDRCERRSSIAPVEIHQPPARKPPTLQCATCRAWKGDAEFARRTPGDTGASSERRGRRADCKTCAGTKRNRAWRKTRERTPSPAAHLTRRQVEFLAHLVDGWSTLDIATEHTLSIETVRWHVKQLYVALGVHTCAEAVACAKRRKA